MMMEYVTSISIATESLTFKLLAVIRIQTYVRTAHQAKSLSLLNIVKSFRKCARIKNRKEVIDEYMRQWDRELSIKREVREETRKETMEEAALEMIKFCKEEGISDDKIRHRIFDRFKLSESKISDLFAKVDAEQAITTK